MSIRVLAVDDEVDNLDLIEDFLSDIDADVVQAQDGQLAWDILQKDHGFDVILLDRMMPNMNGIEFMEKYNSLPSEQKVPVIMQTAAATDEQVEEGVKSGVFYYLVKPFSAGTLTTLVKSATREHNQGNDLRKRMATFDKVQGLVQNCSLRFKGMTDARNVSVYLAACYPEPESVVVGISELLINAVEHGNLCISYDEKTKILEDGGAEAWSDEIDKRLQEDEYKDKWVDVKLEKSKSSIRVSR